MGSNWLNLYFYNEIAWSVYHLFDYHRPGIPNRRKWVGNLLILLPFINLRRLFFTPASCVRCGCCLFLSSSIHESLSCICEGEGVFWYRICLITFPLEITHSSVVVAITIHTFPKGFFDGVQSAFLPDTYSVCADSSILWIVLR